MMNDEEIREICSKFPCVLRKALQDGVVNFNTYDPQNTFTPKTLYRGLRGKNKAENISLFDSDFLSHVELLDLAEKLETDESIKKDLSPDLLEQVQFFANSKMRLNVNRNDLSYYSCSLADDREKLENLYVKSFPDRCVAEGTVEQSHGVLSDKHGKPWHVHCFLYENANIKSSFEVCK